MSGRPAPGLFRLLARPTAAAGNPVVARVEVPADSPLFDGHFPGRPILPGVAHLALVQWLLAQVAAGAAGPAAPQPMAQAQAILEVRSWRLRRPVLPGDRLEVHLAAGEPAGEWRCELRRGAEVASQGLVCLGATAPEPGSPPPAGFAGSVGGALPHPADLLPHGPAACLLTAVVGAGPAGVVCHGAVPGGHPLVRDGGAPGFLALEMAAQAAAVLQALREPPEAGGPRIGYLVGVRNARLPAFLQAGAWRVAATPAGGAGPLALYDLAVGSLDDPAHPAATGTISTFVDRS